MHQININRVKYLIELRNYTIFVVVVVVGRGRCWFGFYFFFWSFIQKPITCVKEGKERCWFCCFFFVFLFCSSLSFSLTVLCTSLDYEIHTLRIGQQKGITKHENIFFKSRSTGPCVYIYPYAPLVVPSLSLTRALDLALAADLFSFERIHFHTQFFF